MAGPAEPLHRAGFRLRLASFLPTWQSSVPELVPPEELPAAMALGGIAINAARANPLMMRSALNALNAHSETTAMIGDRMDTDIVAGLEAGMETILVLTGVTEAEETERFPYRPTRIVDSVADLVAELG